MLAKLFIAVFIISMTKSQVFATKNERNKEVENRRNTRGRTTDHHEEIGTSNNARSSHVNKDQMILKPLFALSQNNAILQGDPSSSHNSYYGKQNIDELSVNEDTTYVTTDTHSQLDDPDIERDTQMLINFAQQVNEETKNDRSKAKRHKSKTEDGKSKSKEHTSRNKRNKSISVGENFKTQRDKSKTTGDKYKKKGDTSESNEDLGTSEIASTSNVNEEETDLNPSLTIDSNHALLQKNDESNFSHNSVFHEPCNEKGKTNLKHKKIMLDLNKVPIDLNEVPQENNEPSNSPCNQDFTEQRFRKGKEQIVIQVADQIISKRERGQSSQDKHFQQNVQSKQNENIVNFKKPVVEVASCNKKDSTESVEILRNHKFVSFEKYRNCHHCYAKHKDRNQSRKNRVTIKTACLDCGWYMCGPCFQVNHYLDSYPTLYREEQRDQVCIYCGENIGNNEDELVDHTYICEEIQKQKDGPFGCYACDVSKPYEYHMRIHIRHHTGHCPHKCELCNFRAKDLTALASHMRSSKHKY